MNKKIVKICIFDKNSTPEQVLQCNGDYILDNICIKCEVIEGLDGTYELDAEFICDSEGLYKTIRDESIVKVYLDYGEEIFRIAKITKSTRDIEVFARQITIAETLDMWLEDVRPTETSGLGALAHMKDNCIGKRDIQVSSDIDTINTAYYQRMCMYKAIHDCEQSFTNRWGGEVLRRGYNLTINNHIGSDRGVEIRSRKNLIGFEANTNIDNVVTRIRPVGYEGITTDEFVDSDLIDTYSSIKIKEIKYEDVKVKPKSDNEGNSDAKTKNGAEQEEQGFDTLEEAQAELIRRATLEFTEKHIDELRADYKINFIYLEQTEEYKNYAQAERVYLGDTVSVYEETHNVNIHVRVIKRKYDVLRQKVIEIELSNTDITQKNVTTSDILAELQSTINNTNNNNVQEVIQSMINSGVKDSYVISRQNEIVIADNKDLNLANNVCRLNKNGLGFSKNGYYGDYTYGFTIDGVMNASLIATGILSSVLIQNKDGSLQIDLSGSNGIMTQKNGKNAIELAGTILNFFDWDGEGEPVGQLFSSRLNDDQNATGIALANKLNSYLSLLYQQDDSFYAYMRFDKNNTVKNTKVPITVFEETEFGTYVWFGHGINSVYNSTNNNLVNRVKNGFVVVDANTLLDMLHIKKNELSLYDSAGDPDTNRYCLISPGETFFGSDGHKYFAARPNGFSFWKDSDDIFYTTTVDTIQSDRGFHVNGNFTVNGNKNCVQKTEHYGDRLFYSVEDCESYFTDRSMELFTVERTEEGTYERVILLDNVFKESINLDKGYTVEIIKQSWGDYRIKDQTSDYFIVEAERQDFTFKYVITGKRKGFEEERNGELFSGVKSFEDIESNPKELFKNTNNISKGEMENEETL